MIRMIRLC